MSYTKILESDYADKGVIGLPTKPSYQTSEMQRKFEEISLDVIIPAYNRLCDELDTGGSAENERIENIETYITTLDETTIPQLEEDIIEAEANAKTYTDEQIAEIPTVPDWALAENKPTYTAAEVGALPSSTVVPTKTSELTNDSGFITSATIPTKTSELTNDSGFVTSDDVPTKTSQLTNDSGFLTEHQDISGKQDKLTAGDNITINGNTISATNTTVAVNPIRTSGAHIADITVDGTAYELYAPNDGGGGGGTTDYSDLTSKPSINSVELIGNKTLTELGIASASDLSALSDIVGQVNTLLEGV